MKVFYNKKLAEEVGRRLEEYHRIKKLLHEDAADDWLQANDKSATAPKEPGIKSSKVEEEILAGIANSAEVLAAQKKWGPQDNTLEGEKRILAAAKAGDKTALVYIFAKNSNMIAKLFWKFLGPNRKYWARRIANGDMKVYISLSFGELFGGNRLGTSERPGLIEQFNPDLYTHGTIWSGLGNKLRQRIMDITEAWNKSESRHGMSGVGEKDKLSMQSYDQTYDDGGDNYSLDAQAAAQSGNMDPTASKGMTAINASDALKKWKKLAQDPELYANPKLPIVKIWKEIFANPGTDKKVVAQAAGVNPLQVSKQIEALLGLFPKYDLEKSDMNDIIKEVGIDKLVGYLVAGEAMNGVK